METEARGGKTARNILLMTALAFATCAASAASRASDSWQSLGPFGGSVQAIAVSPARANTIYAAADSVGVFRTTDGGARWSRTGLQTQATIGALVVDPAGPDWVYAASLEGIYVSADAGATWKLSNQGLRSTYATALALDPAKSGTLYAGGWGGVSKTLDRGNTWADASVGLPADVFIASLALDPSRPSTLYAATTDGIWKTADGGATWSASSEGLGERNLRSLALDPVNPEVLYVATDTQGIWRSEDGARSWHRAWTDPDSHTFRVLAASGAVLASTQGGGLYRTADAGMTWTHWNDGLPEFDAPYALALASDGTAFCGLFLHGVFRRPAQAMSWSETNAGLTGYVVSDLLVNEASGILYAGVSSYGPSVFQSADRGSSWRMTRRGMFYPPVNALLEDSRDPQAILSGNNGSVFQSCDGGETWKPSDAGMVRGGVGVHSLARDPRNADMVFAGTSTGVWRSLDGGATWGEERLPDRAVRALAHEQDASPRILAGTDAGEVYASSNAGQTWVLLGAGFSGGNPVRALLSISGVIYAACGSAGLYRGSADGKSWLAVPLASTTVGAFSLLPLSSGRFSLLIGTDAGVYALDAQGAWTNLAPLLPPGTRVDTLARDPATGQIYAAGHGGVFVAEAP